MWSPLKSVEDKYTRQSDRAYFVYSFVFHDKVTKIRVDITRRPRSSTKITLWSPPSLAWLILWIVNNHNSSRFTITSRWLWTQCCFAKSVNVLLVKVHITGVFWTILCVAHKAKEILKHILKFREVSVAVSVTQEKAQTAKLMWKYLLLGLFVAIGV